ncbi:hypothetical protein BGI40_03055 [Snodgrassella communis]|uniref:23S rRNA methyltransferase n=1 Tax=Snodgrassella communis TaxID=2946699 RepID=A0A066TFL5_9NEIS|nr:hypothetical protein [Snodgrassella communis]KDN12312.1 hypothetical protein SALWKB12_1400 [Snodgrassella communis]KDN14950.1 hypothetical protein SALWKB29_1022 [Snodgrassella communis]PIT08630.1 hypothetical protein BGI29_07355 [Snodgrassella communis]PIT29408.1 hypothetical protein BGI39_03380 [Snodgrassella communis]PIT29615.1 hypothetical protein BGI38_03355 [Snodgrassella communis]
MELYLPIALLVILLVVLLVLKKRQKAGAHAKGKSAARKKQPASKRKKDAGSKNTDAQASPVGEEATESLPEDWDWQPAQPDKATVSVATVDHLTEYKVYKQFGYFQKAADSLASYLEHNAAQQSPAMANTLVNELAGLCIEAKNTDKLAEVIDQYRSYLQRPELESLIRQGLALDENHLGLRVLAEDLLQWDVKETEKEVGINQDKKTEDTRSDAESASNTPDITEQPRELLVEGNMGNFKIRGDERDVLLSFSKPENSYVLLKEQLPYDAAIRCLNKAIKTSKKPAGLIIDALALDYRRNNINVFAQHLWRLYYTLGQYGNVIKERMLGWGYSLGQHPMFDLLEAKPNETVLRDIGITQGYLPVNSSALKAKRLSLVDKASSDNDVAETPAELVLRDVESLLTFGQFDEATDLLEKSVLLYPQESQLYITLFDLYERAEEWTRLEKMLQVIRAEIQTPPEEVVLAMSQLLKRINHGGVQNQ